MKRTIGVSDKRSYWAVRWNFVGSSDILWAPNCSSFLNECVSEEVKSYFVGLPD